MGKIKIVYEDCLNELKEISGCSVGLILTDCFQRSNDCKFDKDIPYNQIMEQLNRIIQPNGSIYLFGDEPFSSSFYEKKNQEKMDYLSKINLWLIQRYREDLFDEFEIDSNDILSVSRLFDAIYEEQCKEMPLPWYQYGIGNNE